MYIIIYLGSYIIGRLNPLFARIRMFSRQILDIEQLKRKELPTCNKDHYQLITLLKERLDTYVMLCVSETRVLGKVNVSLDVLFGYIMKANKDFFKITRTIITLFYMLLRS